MKTRMRPARSTTATEIATLRFAHSAMAAWAISRPSPHVMSFCICTPPSAYAKPGSMQAAVRPIAKPVRIDMLKSSLGRNVVVAGPPPARAAVLDIVANPGAVDAALRLRSRSLLQLIRHLGDAGIAAGLFLRAAIRGTAETDAPNGLVADLDRDAALQRNDLGKRPLTLNLGLGALGPIDGGAAKRP